MPDRHGGRVTRDASRMSVRGASLAFVDAAIWIALGLSAATSLGTLFYVGSSPIHAT
jgi:hypothetical protein